MQGFKQKKSTLITTTVTLLLFSVFLFLRKPSALTHPQFWAEDGFIFFREVYQYGIKSFILPYEGYLLIIPRIVAYVTNFISYIYAPAIYNYITLILSLLVAYKILSCRLDFKYKPLLVLSIVLVPTYGEVYLTITNIQWILALLLPIFALQDLPRSRSETISDYLILFIIGMTGPFGLIALPLFLYRYFKFRDNYSLHLLLIILFTSFIQSYFILSIIISNQSLADHSLTTLSFGLLKMLIEIFDLRIFGLLFLGINSSTHITPLPLFIGGILLLASMIFLAKKEKSLFEFMIVFLYFGLTVFILGFLKTNADNPRNLLHPYFGDRYFFIINVLIVWFFILSLSFVPKMKYFIFGILLLVLFSSYRADGFFHELPNMHWKHYAKKITPCESTAIPINPSARWEIFLSKKRDCKI